MPRETERSKMALFCTADREYDDGGVRISGLAFIAVDFAVFGGVEGPVLRVQVFRRHREDVAIFLSLEAHGVVAALGIDHPLCEGSGVHEFAEAGGIVVIL